MKPFVTMKCCMAVFILTIVGAAPLAAQSMPPLLMPRGFVDEMPAPAQVLASFGGSDSLDQTARQKAAFIVLRQLIFEGTYGRLTAEEQRVYKSYADAEDLVPAPHFDEAESRLGWASPSGKWTKLQQDLILDPAFRSELLDRFFSPGWKASFLAVEARLGHNVQAYKDQQQVQAARNARDDAQAAIKQTAQRPADTGTSSVAAHGPAKPSRSPSGNLLGYTVVALLLTLWLAREIRPFGLDVSDPFLIHSGWTSFKLHSSTGTVLSPTKSRVATTYVSGGGNQPVSTSTSTSIHDQFFIRESNGLERGLQLTNVNVALREGHRLTAVWSIRRGKKTGSYFLFRNHSTRDMDYVDQVLRRMLRPRAWPVLPLIFTSMVMVSNWLRSVEPALAEKVTWAYFSSGTFWGLLLATVLAVVFGFHWTIRIRVQRLKRQIADTLLPILDRRASGQIEVAPSGVMVSPS